MRGSVLEAENLRSKPCHILCQLGMGLDSVDDVQAVCLEQTFRLS